MKSFSSNYFGKWVWLFDKSDSGNRSKALIIAARTFPPIIRIRLISEKNLDKFRGPWTRIPSSEGRNLSSSRENCYFRSDLILIGNPLLREEKHSAVQFGCSLAQKAVIAQRRLKSASRRWLMADVIACLWPQSSGRGFTLPSRFPTLARSHDPVYCAVYLLYVCIHDVHRSDR